MTKRYPWTRFWCKPTGQVSLSDAGFLVDPESEYGNELNPDVVSWNEISKSPCLILLGEPGIGKSTALKDEYDRTMDASLATGDQVLHIDLRGYQTDQRLHESVFESALIKSWTAGTHQLHLFVDSMDEALIRIDNIGAVLLTELKQLPVPRLNLRLACRTADWPRSLESELAKLWADKNAVDMYELSPLRRIDVEAAIRENEWDPDSVISQLIHCNAVPLAIKPVTLEFLLNTFRRFGKFPSTQVELYDQGCRLLCEDQRTLRPATSASEYTAGQKAAVASRLAVVTILCNRYAVWTDVDRGDVPLEDLRISDMLGGMASWQNEQIEVGEDAIRQSLNTGLFSSRGPSQMGWAHQTYAEFMAAKFLVSGNLTVDQVLSLLLHEDGKVVPQVHQLAAWAAMMVPDLFRRLMKTDAEFLLRSDAATTDFKDRQDLVENLLALFDQGELLDFDWDLRRRYRKLGHPNLAQQLQPYIGDKTKGNVVRRVAIHIAEACEVQSLQDSLVERSLDSSDVHEIRVVAAHAIFRIGTESGKQAMSPLVLSTTAGPDPDDELRGCGLRCCWPDYLSATEFFQALTPEKKSNRIGMYRTFLTPEIAAQVDKADLPIALDWAADRGGAVDPLDPLTEIADAIAARAIDYLDTSAVSDALIRTVRAWIDRAFDTFRSEKSQFRTRLSENEHQRRALLTRLLPLVAGATFELLHMYGGTLIASHDFHWLLYRLPETGSLGEQRTIIELSVRLYKYDEDGHTDALLLACKENELLAREFSWLINPVILGSPEALDMRTRWDRAKEFSSRPEQPPLLDPSPQQRVEEQLQRIVEGDLNAFWMLNLDLTLDSHSTGYGDEWEPDLMELTGWKKADDPTRAKIISAAKLYLTKFDPPTSQTYIKTANFPRPALAGYRSLLLLLNNQHDFVEHLEKECWQKWAAIIIGFPHRGDPQRSPGSQQLSKHAYENAPEEVISTLNALIEKDNEQFGILFALSRVESIWDGKIAASLIAKLNDSELRPAVAGTILDELLKHKESEARVIANAILNEPIPPEGDQRHRAVLAAQALIRNATNCGWEVVWPAVQKDTDFGFQVFAGIANIDAFSGVSVAKLNDDELADLYIWLVKQVPYRDDDANTSGFVTPAQSLGHWRDAVLVLLKRRGTVTACDGLRQAMIEFPGLPWLKWHLREAEQLTRRHSWDPLPPRALLTLTGNSGHHLVQHGGQLLDVLMESLRRLEVKLQGETPAVPALWNDVSKHCCQPKEEARLSDYVKRHFEEDIRNRGIIVNREVEIRGRMGNNPGEETDIHVDAISPLLGGKYDRISAIVEVKGCWNKDLWVAMQTQLKDRYLKDNGSAFGLYLVGWFHCPQWNSSDYRKAVSPQISLDEARSKFEFQAAALSSSEAHLKAFVLNASLR